MLFFQFCIYFFTTFVCCTMFNGLALYFQTEIFDDTEAQLTKMSKINLIDLAGSERASNVLNDQAIHNTETANLRLKVQSTQTLHCSSITGTNLFVYCWMTLPLNDLVCLLFCRRVAVSTSRSILWVKSSRFCQTRKSTRGKRCTSHTEILSSLGRQFVNKLGVVGVAVMGVWYMVHLSQQWIHW